MPNPTSLRMLALLRGINVAGHNVKMDRLRQLTQDIAPELGLSNISTYIQSGNLIFDLEAPPSVSRRDNIRRQLEEHLTAQLGWQVTALLRSWSQLDAVASSNAFDGVDITPDTRLLVLFLSSPLPHGAVIAPPTARESYELVRLNTGEAYIVMRLVNGRPGNPAALLEKRFGIRVTARFFGTLSKMRDATRPVN